ncbi:MAG: 3-isopropylmalate dehydratase small subunit [Planctomycetota bacterium]|jgi:3-isopropylmalate/(R)-2-methylmalate dehydratase small subunit
MKFEKLRSRAVVLTHDDIDTDQIIPARFLTCIDRSGLADGLFYGLRKTADCPLNFSGARTSRILIAGDNFGCGSSREHAVWALQQWGFRVIIARSFGDIFKVNAQKNGLLAISCSNAFIAALALSKKRICVDLNSQTVALGPHAIEKFEIDPFSRRLLLEGLDELGYLLAQTNAITTFEGAGQ